MRNQELIQEIQDLKRQLARKKERLTKAKEFNNFIQIYLPDSFTLPFCEQHFEIIRVLQDRNILKALIMFPREHGKSTIVSYAAPLYLLLNDYADFVVLFSATAEQAQMFGLDLRLTLENNELLIGDYNIKQGEKWKENWLEFETSGKLKIIALRGAMQSSRGLKRGAKRPDLIICDDLLTEKMRTSAIERTRLIRWFKHVVMNLGKDAKLFVIGTPLHPEDLVMQLYNEWQNEPDKWVVKYPAIINGQPLWPEKWSIKALERKRIEIGDVAFQAEFMLNPTSPEELMFREDWFVYYEPQELRGKLLTYIMGIDPATGAGDYQAIVTVAYERATNTYYVLDAWGGKLSPLKFIDKIIEKYITYQPQIVVLETTAFQKFLKTYLLEKAYKKGIHLPIVEVTHAGVNKVTRISRLGPMLELGMIQFRKNQKLLLEQLKVFPKGTHDDLPDALEMATSVSSDKHAVHEVIHRGIRGVPRRLLGTTVRLP